MGDGPTTAQIESEDWLRGLHWGLVNPDGSPVATLDELATVLGQPRRAAADLLLRLPFGKAAPDALRDEAKTEVDGGTPADDGGQPEGKGLHMPWNAADHPRDRNGRWARVGSLVSLIGGGQGRVEAVHGNSVDVRLDDGSTDTVKVKDVEVIPPPAPKAPSGPPPGSPAAAAQAAAHAAPPTPAPWLDASGSPPPTTTSGGSSWSNVPGASAPPAWATSGPQHGSTEWWHAQKPKWVPPPPPEWKGPGPETVPPEVLKKVAEARAKRHYPPGETATWPPRAVSYYADDQEFMVMDDSGGVHYGAYGGAGALLRNVDKDGTVRFMLQKRSGGVQNGGTWSTPGGAMLGDEDPAGAALREVDEEIGMDPADLTPAKVFTDDYGGWAYNTVVLDAPTRDVTAKNNWESRGVDWFTASEILFMRRIDVLHPGFDASWDALIGMLTEGEGPAMESKAARWDPAKHPRDKHGMFATIGSLVRLSGGGSGRVEATAGGGRVRVRKTDGTSTTVRAVDVEVTQSASQARSLRGGKPAQTPGQQAAREALRTMGPPKGPGGTTSGPRTAKPAKAPGPRKGAHAAALDTAITAMRGQARSDADDKDIDTVGRAQQLLGGKGTPAERVKMADELDRIAEKPGSPSAAKATLGAAADVLRGERPPYKLSAGDTVKVDGDTYKVRSARSDDIEPVVVIDLEGPGGKRHTVGVGYGTPNKRFEDYVRDAFPQASKGTDLGHGLTLHSTSSATQVVFDGDSIAWVSKDKDGNWYAVPNGPQQEHITGSSPEDAARKAGEKYLLGSEDYLRAKGKWPKGLGTEPTGKRKAEIEYQAAEAEARSLSTHAMYRSKQTPETYAAALASVKKATAAATAAGHPTKDWDDRAAELDRLMQQAKLPRTDLGGGVALSLFHKDGKDQMIEVDGEQVGSVTFWDGKWRGFANGPDNIQPEGDDPADVALETALAHATRYDTGTQAKIAAARAERAANKIPVDTVKTGSGPVKVARTAFLGEVPDADLYFDPRSGDVMNRGDWPVGTVRPAVISGNDVFVAREHGMGTASSEFVDTEAEAMSWLVDRWAKKNPPGSEMRAPGGGGTEASAKTGSGKSVDYPEEFKAIAAKGRPHPPAAGTVEDPIDVAGDIGRAAQLIGDGKHVRLNQPDEVATLLNVLRKIVDDAKKKGEKAPTYDLCRVSVPGTNLFCAQSKGIPRVKMPQFGGEPVPGSRAEREAKDGKADGTAAFLDALQKSGIAVTSERRPASHLRASQSQLDGAKVAGMTGAMEAGKIPDAPIFISRDGYVIDGHHRWAAKVGMDLGDGVLGDIDMPVTVLDLDIGAALDYANAFTKEYGIKSQDVTVNLAETGAVGKAQAASRPGAT